MRLPHEYWLKYLLLSGMSHAKIAATAEMYSLWQPDKQYLSDLAGALKRTKPKPFRKDTVKVKNWIRRQRVASLMFEDSYAVEARDLLGDEKVRRVIEALLISGTPTDRIPGYISKITGRKVAEKTIALYQHYFFNTGIVAAHHWDTLLEDHTYGAMLTAGLDRGTEFVLWKLGHREEIASDTLVRGVLHEASMRFFELGGYTNGRFTAMTAKMWSEIIFKSLEELGQSGDAVQKVLDELKTISIKLDRVDIPDIEKLTEGRYPRGTKEKK